MPLKAFYVDEVAIEGFKGFTNRKVIKLDGKHTFLLGPNGFGKSSVIEAIRWGLFGSTGRPGETVPNQRYLKGDCQVEIGLRRADGSFSLRRRVIKGVSGGSDATMVDAAGREVPIRDVLPELASAPAGEGMHVVYAAQTLRLKRAVEDLEPFERTLYSYLGLTDVPLVLKRLDSFALIQEATENDVGTRISEVRRAFEAELARLTDMRDRILENAPWGGGPVPTYTATLERLRQFGSSLVALETGAVVPQSEDLDTVLQGLQALHSRIGKARPEEELKNLQSEIQGLKSTIANLRSLGDGADQLRVQVQGAEGALRNTLQASTLEELRTQLVGAEREVEQHALERDFALKALQWLKHDSSQKDEGSCPLCTHTVELAGLRKNLNDRFAGATKDEARLLQTRDTVREKVAKATGQSQQLTLLRQQLAQAEERLTTQLQTAARALSLEEGKPANEEMIAARVHELEGRATVIKTQSENETQLQQDRERQLLKLRDEVYFHNLQKQLRQVAGRLEEVQRAQGELQLLTRLGESAKEIKSALGDSLLETLKTNLPPVNGALSQAFVALTQHPAYDRILVDPSLLPKLTMRVGSTSDPTGKWDESVLNGQAASALQLVPFFAFSALTEAPFEVYLLLLDDPTQAFDKDHVEKLIAKLADLGEHVQLIVASHEADLFKTLVPQHFPADSYKMAMMTSFTLDGGPVPAFVHG